MPVDVTSYVPQQQTQAQPAQPQIVIDLNDILNSLGSLGDWLQNQAPEVWPAQLFLGSL